jgi:putative Mg2+ transporter-C (MgtC) family protein
MFVEGMAVTVMGLLALTFLRKFEDKNDKLSHRYISLKLADEPSVVPNLMESMSRVGASVSHFDYEKTIADKVMNIDFEVKYPQALNGLFVETLEKQSGLIKIHVSEHRPHH